MQLRVIEAFIEQYHSRQRILRFFSIWCASARFEFRPIYHAQCDVQYSFVVD